MIYRLSVALALSAATSSVQANAQSDPAPVVAPTLAIATEAPAPQAAAAQLPSHTDLLLRLNSQLTSRDHRIGDTFSMSVVRDVAVDGHVVIPAGTRAVGQVTWRTGRGSFGKSGKLEITMRYLELGDRRIPINGFFRQEGEGNTGATIGAVVAAGLVGGLIVHGRTAVIPEGRELAAYTVDAIPVMLPASGSAATAAVIDASYTPTDVSMTLGRRRDDLNDGRSVSMPRDRSRH